MSSLASSLSIASAPNDAAKPSERGGFSLLLAAGGACVGTGGGSIHHGPNGDQATKVWDFFWPGNATAIAGRSLSSAAMMLSRVPLATVGASSEEISAVLCGSNELRH